MPTVKMWLFTGLLGFSWACSENPLDPDDAIDPEVYLFGDEQPEQGNAATCDDVCAKLELCLEFDRESCFEQCPQLTPEDRQNVVDATCEQLEAELG